MKRFWVIFLVFAAAFLVARAAISIKLGGDALTGGGTAAASGGNYKLTGVIDGFGLPDGYATLSQGGTIRLEVGQIPVLIAPIPQNAADPAWLAPELGQYPTHPNVKKRFAR